MILVKVLQDVLGAGWKERVRLEEFAQVNVRTDGLRESAPGGVGE